MFEFRLEVMQLQLKARYFTIDFNQRFVYQDIQLSN